MLHRKSRPKINVGNYADIWKKAVSFVSASRIKPGIQTTKQFFMIIGMIGIVVAAAVFAFVAVKGGQTKDSFGKLVNRG